MLCQYVMSAVSLEDVSPQQRCVSFVLLLLQEVAALAAQLVHLREQAGMLF
jgi:hypothetical protein